MTPPMQIDRAEYLEVFFPKPSDAELAALVSSNPPLARKCSGCAYSEATEANMTKATAENRDACDETGHPFWCHMVQDSDGMCRHLCAGWMEKNHAD